MTARVESAQMPSAASKMSFIRLRTGGLQVLTSAAPMRGNTTLLRSNPGNVQACQSRPNINLGICGEHGGDPESVKFCHRIGLNYVSCSPYRVPVARLAAAQAALEEKKSKAA